MVKINITPYKKIALSGYHGAGKTTLAKKITEITGYTYIPEVARELLEKKIELSNGSFDWKKEKDETLLYCFQSAILWEHLFYVLNSDKFIVDRTVFDIFAYCEYQNKRLDSEIFTFNFTPLNVNFKKLYDCVLFYREGYTQKNNDETKLFIDKVLEEIYSVMQINAFSIKVGDILVFEGQDILI